MKKILLTIGFAILCVGIISAQTIPNNDFENWAENDEGFMDPTDWGTSNVKIDVVLDVYEFNTVTQIDSDVYSGTYAAEATNVYNDMGALGEAIIPGILTLGEFVLDIANSSGSIEGGLPFTDRPYYLKGYFKSAPEPGDSAMIAIGISKWNTATDERDTIGLGVMYSSEVVDTWTEFEIPIDWTSTENPDSMNIVICPSNLMENDVFIEGSSISVDSVWLDYTEPEDLIITSVETIDDIVVDFGTAFGDLTLPDSLGVILDDASTDTLAVSWNEGVYDGNTAGIYTIYGDLTLETGITNPGGLQGEVNVTVDEEVGIAENSSQNIHIYPNPANNLVNVESQHLIKRINLMDITGRTVMQKQINSKKSHININALPEGYYFLNIKTTNAESTVKLIIN
jgi:hypothetical protein